VPVPRMRNRYPRDIGQALGSELHMPRPSLRGQELTKKRWVANDELSVLNLDIHVL